MNAKRTIIHLLKYLFIFIIIGIPIAQILNKAEKEITDKYTYFTSWFKLSNTIKEMKVIVKSIFYKTNLPIDLSFNEYLNFVLISSFA